MAITLGTPIVRSDGKTQVSFSQSAAAGPETLVADPVDGRVVLYSCVTSLSVTGTVTLVGATGAIDLIAGYPVDLVTNPALPLELAESEALSITTATGAARGYIVYDIET